MPAKKQRKEKEDVAAQAEEVEQSDQPDKSWCTICDCRFYYRTDKDIQRHNATKQHMKNEHIRKLEDYLSLLLRESPVVTDEYKIRPRIRDIHNCVYADITDDNILGEAAVRRVIDELKLNEMPQTSTTESELGATSLSDTGGPKEPARGRNEGAEAKDSSQADNTQSQAASQSEPNVGAENKERDASESGTGQSSGEVENQEDKASKETVEVDQKTLTEAGDSKSQAEGAKASATASSEEAADRVYNPSERSKLKHHFDKLRSTLENVKVGEITTMVQQMMMVFAMQVMDAEETMDYFGDVFLDLFPDKLSIVPQGQELARYYCFNLPLDIMAAKLEGKQPSKDPTDLERSQTDPQQPGADTQTKESEAEAGDTDSQNIKGVSQGTQEKPQMGQTNPQTEQTSSREPSIDNQTARKGSEETEQTSSQGNQTHTQPA